MSKNNPAINLVMFIIWGLTLLCLIGVAIDFDKTKNMTVEEQACHSVKAIRDAFECPINNQ